MSRATRARGGKLLPPQEVVVVSLPASPSESLVLPILARLGGRAPLVVVYNCDLKLPPGLVGRALGAANFACNAAAGALAARVVTHTQDYADDSRYLRLFAGKGEVIVPALSSTRRMLKTCGVFVADTRRAGSVLSGSRRASRRRRD